MMEMPCRPLNMESFGHKMFIVSSLVSLHARFLLILLTRFIRFILLTRLYILLNDFDFIFCQNSQVLGCLGVAVENQSFSKVLVRIDWSRRVTRRNRHFVRPELVWSQNLAGWLYRLFRTNIIAAAALTAIIFSRRVKLDIMNLHQIQIEMKWYAIPYHDYLYVCFVQLWAQYTIYSI